MCSDPSVAVDLPVEVSQSRYLFLSFWVFEQLLNLNGISQADPRAAEIFVADYKRFFKCDYKTEARSLTVDLNLPLEASHLQEIAGLWRLKKIENHWCKGIFKTS